MPLSDRDYDLLSAYLDGDVTPDERREVEGRLETDADFAAELAALRRTVELVKSLPTLTAPRNLRLTPAMLGDEQPVPHTEPTRYPPLRPSLRQQLLRYAPNLVAAAASFVLVVAGAVTLLQPADAPPTAPIVAMQHTESIETAPATLDETEDVTTFADAPTDGADEFRDALGETEQDRAPADDHALTEAAAAEDTEAGDLSMAARAVEPMGTLTAPPFGTPDALNFAAPGESHGAGALVPMPTLSAPVDALPASVAQASGTLAATATAGLESAAPSSTPTPMPTAPPTTAATAVADAAPPTVAEAVETQDVSAPHQAPALGVALIAAGLILGLLALRARPRSHP